MASRAERVFMSGTDLCNRCRTRATAVYVQCPVWMGESMTSKRKAFVLAVFAAAVLIFIGMSHTSSVQAQARSGQEQPANPVNAAPKTAAPKAAGNVERGRYIVEDVAYCTNCHTPRTTGTNFDRAHWLQGGPLFWQPAHTVPNYPQLVPRIGGQPPATDAQMITLLTTGLWTDGKPLRAPMPPFHMTKEDAEAVLAYLKTIKGAE